MKNLTLSNIASACGGKYVGPQELKDFVVTAITTDSRKATNGCLFVAIQGERADGHKFIPQVMEKGAAAVLAEKAPADGTPYILTDSSLRAVKDIAEFYLKQLNIPVVGIAGSVGKTSTKEMTASVLGQKFRVLKTEGNFNNELGVPLTIFRLRDEDELAVLEMGISDLGEMHRLAKIVRPDTSIMTNIGFCHLENLKDRDGVLKAKSEIYDFLRPDDHIIINGDDDKLHTIKEINGVRPVTYGLDSSNDVWADEIVSMGLKGISCHIHTEKGDFRVNIPMPGRHMVYNALAGTAAGLVYGLDISLIRRGIESFASLGGRFNMIETDKFMIIDDCYNANPVSMKASLDVLQDGSGRKTAILGDMGELGENEKELHADVGAYAASLDIDAVYCAGPLMENFAEAAKKASSKLEVRHFADLEDLRSHLSELVGEGDTILVKASHFMHFEKIVDDLRNVSGQTN